MQYSCPDIVEFDFDCMISIAIQRQKSILTLTDRHENIIQ